MARGDVDLRDIYGAINELRKEIVPRFEKIENRVDTLEDFRSKTLGIISILVLATTGLFTWLWKKITG